MVRKTSDMALLLGSRGRGRSRSGLATFVRGIYESWFGRSQWRSERPARSLQVPGWLAAVALLAAFAGGFLVGGKLGGAPSEGAGLQANKPATPSFVGEFDARPLSRTAFVVAAYPELAEADAKAAAKALSDWLVAQGLAKARPYLFPRQVGPVWTVAVYFDGEAEQQATRNLLTRLPEAVPDSTFLLYRNTEAEWPKPWPIQ